MSIAIGAVTIIVAIFVANMAWPLLVIAGGLFGACYLAYLKDVQRLPTWIADSLLMDILDRLTNKQEFEALLNNSMPAASTRDIDREQMKTLLKEGIIGHDEVIDDVVKQVWSAFKKVDRRKPVGVFMFAGPPSTGKTQFGMTLGKALYGEQGAFYVDMESFSGESSRTTLSGSSPGFAGSDQQSAFVKHLIAHPETVIVLDEFEKAHPKVQRAFLAAWNQGIFPDMTGGRPISTKDAVFVVTTNACQDTLAELAANFTGTRTELSDQCKTVLKGAFEDSLLSRINYVFPLRPLQGANLARLLLKSLEEDIKEYGVKLAQVTPQTLLNYVLQASKRGVDARAMQLKINEDINEQVISLRDAGHREVTVFERNGQVFVEPVRDERPKTTARAKAR